MALSKSARASSHFSASARTRPRRRSNTAFPGSARTASSRSASRCRLLSRIVDRCTRASARSIASSVAKSIVLSRASFAFWVSPPGKRFSLAISNWACGCLGLSFTPFSRSAKASLREVFQPSSVAAFSPAARKAVYALAAARLPRCTRAAAIRSLAKDALPLSSPFFKALSQSWITSLKSPAVWAPSFCCVALSRSAWPSFSARARRGKEPINEANNASVNARIQFRRVMPKYSMRKEGLFQRFIIYAPAIEIEGRKVKVIHQSLLCRPRLWFGFRLGAARVDQQVSCPEKRMRGMLRHVGFGALPGQLFDPRFGIAV